MHVVGSFLHRGFELVLVQLSRIVSPSRTRELSEVNFEGIMGPYLVWVR
jgi:hypothetical protein